jgi:hypothetical protein
MAATPLIRIGETGVMTKSMLSVKVMQNDAEKPT